jgi:predicted MFS family arabinose efflux permease
MKEKINGLVRTGLAAVGGGFVMTHLDDLTTVVTGVLVILGTAVWSWWSKRNANK